MAGDDINPFEPEHGTMSENREPGSDAESLSLSNSAFAIVFASSAVGVPAVVSAIRRFDTFAHFDHDHQTNLVFRFPIFLCVLGSTLLYAHGARTWQILTFAVLCLALSVVFAMFSPFHLGWFPC